MINSIKKIPGLMFLNKYFPRNTVDCIFVDKPDDINNEEIKKNDNKNPIWRVRAGNRYGSELNLPMKTFHNPDDISKYIKEINTQNPGYEYVIHRVSQKYFEAPYVGTLAVYGSGDYPVIRIEIQRAERELVASIDKGKRPRDWPSCLIMDYNYLSKTPRILKKDDNVDLDRLKEAILSLYNAGIKINNIYENKGLKIDTVTRYNIYEFGGICDVLFDDHRSIDSFTPVIDKNTEKNKFNEKKDYDVSDR